MAVLQRQYPRPFQRPAAPTVPSIKLPRGRSRVFMREAQKARRISLAACIVTASLLVFYIAGHARMAAINYQRVNILGQVRSLRETNLGMEAEILRRSDKAALADWAKHHGMVLDSKDPYNLAR